ncbi:uncharacterized protein LOC106637233 [Copidosoma floridanum]|uniref:uncharacterized protein LOC106637233 n=1 Tax=Copidosoma floridanum TaxID=29053 RepID=UPI0006C9D9A5|nr:uncharacterized protein LOC106637233 [Copidosoma floridanum]
MAPLPAARITPTRAFLRTGVEYARPFSILLAIGQGIRASNGYAAVFVCMTSEAINLELSDNATCSRAADRKLCEAIQDAELRWDRIAGSLANQGVSWRFIPPRAPHFDGLWEAGFKAMKSHFHRTIGPRNLAYEEFYTVLTSIEAVLNSRLLTPLTGGPNVLDVLTP